MIPPDKAQLVIGNAGLVVANVAKRAPGLLVKLNWNRPFVANRGLLRIVGVGRATFMLTRLPLLAAPLTKTVTKA